MKVSLQGGPSRLVRTGAVVAAIALLGGLGWSYATPGAARAAGTGPRLALNAHGDGVSCDAASQPTACSAPVGGTFTVSVDMIDPPPAGYIAFQAQFVFGDLLWVPGAAAAEAVWPDNRLPVRSPDPPAFGTRHLEYGGLTGTSPPFPVSHYAGPMVETKFKCSPSPASFDVPLIAYSDSTLYGASYTLPDQTVVPAKTARQQNIDLNGDGTPESVPVAEALTINCQVVPPTPTSTQRPPQAAATATQGLPSTGSGGVGGANSPSGLWVAIGSLVATALTALGVSSLRFSRKRRVK